VWEFAPGGKLLRRLGDREPAEWRYAADPAAAPARLDWTDPAGEDTVEGIYKVDGDVLTLCYSHNPADDRPTKFESPTGSRLVVLTFKRVKPKD
jgi:uncharacterized protein (TIGR03067 family)